MKANPGGQISPSDILGRDGLIQRLWRILERQSLVLSAEQRMGKTCIVKKMIAEAPHDKLPIYHDLEGVRTPLEFAEIVFRDVEGYLRLRNQIAGSARQWLAHLTGMELGGIIKFPDTVADRWKELLIHTIEDLVEHLDRTVIFFWDEMPLMLYNIKQRSGEDAAMEMLDVLRSLRQMHSDLRMVFTGSVGLHNVIISLKRAGYANDPTNDMDTIDVPPLSPAAAQELVCQLLEGEGISTDDLQATAQTIAAAVDGIPYFIHHVIDQIAQRSDAATAATAGEIVEACLTDPQDRWHLRYYRERIEVYYANKEKPFALSLLDDLSVADKPLTFDDLFNRLKSHIATEDSEMSRDVLALLQRDHYVVQQPDGKYLFRFPLIQRCWRLHRGLGR